MKVSYDMGAPAHWFESDYCLKLAVMADQAGFDDIWMGDHFLPWFHTHAHSPQAWIWMTAAAGKTRRASIGSAATAPMFKYHPAVVAQAFATMSCLYPGRIKLVVGTGEALNERPFVDKWPPWGVRAEMLVEAVDLMRRFWSSADYFTFEGKYFRMKDILCYDRPPSPIPLYFSAYGPKAAEVAGRHCDGLVTWGLKFDYTRTQIMPRFRRGARSAGRDPEAIEKVAWVDCGFGDQRELLDKFRRSSASWFIPTNYDEPDPRKAERNAYGMTDEEIRRMAVIAEDPEDFVKIVERCDAEGMDHVIFSDSSLFPEKTIAMLGNQVVPRFK